MPEQTLLIGDIGGTNARFALADAAGPDFHSEMTLLCSEFASADDAIREYLQQQSAGKPDVICLAAAGPVMDERVQFTNNHWTLDAHSLREDFEIASVRLLNDFEATAYCIPSLQESDLDSIGLPEGGLLDAEEFNVAIVGPGTGLGAAGLIRRGELLLPIVGESGHIGFAPKSQVQIDVLEVLRGRYDRVSVERLVSGGGIENIYWALTQIHGESRTQLSAAEIFASSDAADDARAIEATQLFFELLGQVAGDIALVLGAQDGVYIAGGIAKRYPTMLRHSGFRNAFDNKGNHRSYMERIPTLLITHEQPGLLGAAYCAVGLLSS